MKLLYKWYLKPKRYRDITNRRIDHTMKMELEHLPMWMVTCKNSKILANSFIEIGKKLMKILQRSLG